MRIHRKVLNASTWRFPPLSGYPDPRGAYSQSYWTGTPLIIIHPAAVDESIASVLETRGHTPVGQRDSERLPVSGNDKNVSRNGKTRDGTVDDPVLRDHSSEFLAPSEFSGDFPRLASRKLTDPSWRRKLSRPMFPIAIFLLIILFPVLIPASVHAIHAIAEASQRRRERIANSLGDGVGAIGEQSISHENTGPVAVL
jgi:hypothetical protein